MPLVGRTITIVDEETGELQRFRFTDTPLARAVGAVQSACDSFGLDKDEIATFVWYVLQEREPLAGISRKGIPPVSKPGVRKLIDRGWVVQIRSRLHLVDRPEMPVIFGAMRFAIAFGEVEGRA